MARLLLIVVLLAGALHANAAWAQSNAGSSNDDPPPLFQPPAEVKPKEPVVRFEGGEKNGSKAICVEVEIDGIRSFNCANEIFRGIAAKTPPTWNRPPADAHAIDIRTGVANQAAIKQQYGRNFGRSVIPFRP